MIKIAVQNCSSVSIF